MKIRAHKFTKKAKPKSITVEMTVDEAAVLYAFVGYIAPKNVTDAMGDIRWGNAHYDIADCLGEYFNTFWENGIDDVAPPISVSILSKTE